MRTVFTFAPLLLQGPTVTALLLVQSANVAAPLHVLGNVLPSRTQAPITLQGPAFLPMASAPVLLLGALAPPAPMQSAGAPLQSAAMHPISGALLNQSMPYPSAFMAPPAWPVNMSLITSLGPRHSRGKAYQF